MPLKFRCPICDAPLELVTWHAVYTSTKYTAFGRATRDTQVTEDPEELGSEWECTKNSDHDVTNNGEITVAYDPNKNRYFLRTR